MVSPSPPATVDAARHDRDHRDDHDQATAATHDDASVSRATAAAQDDDSTFDATRRTLKRRRRDAADDAIEDGAPRPQEHTLPSMGTFTLHAAPSFAEAMKALNASLVAALRTQLSIDPTVDLSPLTRAYDASVQALRTRFASPEAVARALQVLHEAEQDHEQEQDHDAVSAESVSFVASSDVAEMGERERDEDEVYFGASLDLHALSSSSRQSDFVVSGGGDDSPTVEDGGGFLANHEAYVGAASIWNDPTILALRLASNNIQLHSLLSTNGYAENWRATYAQRPVVVKRLAAGATQTMTYDIALAQHIQAIAPLRHPRLVTVIGIAWEKAVDLQATSEFMERGDLRSLLNSPDARTATWADFKCHVAIHVAEAFAYVHSQLHCATPSQVTSHKVLFDSSGAAKLQMLQLSSICGAVYAQLPWTAPELLRGEPRTTQSDMYTMGVLLSELDTTHVPYETATSPNGAKMEPASVAQHVVCGALTPLLSDACPVRIAALARQCLALEPAVRPEAERVVYALREIHKNDL